MNANTGRRKRLRLIREAFDARARDLLGDIPQYRVAEHFGLHPSVLSALRNGSRQPSAEFIARLLAEFPDSTFDELIETVEVSDNGHRVLAAKIAANTRWAYERERQSPMSAAHRGFLARFEREVDPDGLLSADERMRRARSAMKAHMASLALKRHRSQRAA